MSFPRVCRGPPENVVGVERSVRNVGDPCHSCLGQGCPANHQEDGTRGRGSRMTSEYSEDGRAVHRGKGVTVGRSPQRKLVPDMQGRSTQANLPEGHSDLPDRGVRKRVSPRSPVRENCTPGSVRGASGNWRPYRDGLITWKGVVLKLKVGRMKGVLLLPDPHVSTVL